MANSGSAMMGIGKATGENRAVEAAEKAISSPLLEETINGATGVLLNVSGGESLTLHEVNDVADIIYSAVDPDANILFGSVIDESLKDEIMVTVIATGFNIEENTFMQQAPIQNEVESPPQAANISPVINANESFKPLEDVHPEPQPQPIQQRKSIETLHSSSGNLDQNFISNSEPLNKGDRLRQPIPQFNNKQTSFEEVEEDQLDVPPFLKNF